MKSQEFKKQLLEIIEADFSTFEANQVLEDASFCVWVGCFMAWMEFSDHDDCVRYYGDSDE